MPCGRVSDVRCGGRVVPGKVDRTLTQDIAKIVKSIEDFINIMRKEIIEANKGPRREIKSGRSRVRDGSVKRIKGGLQTPSRKAMNNCASDSILGDSNEYGAVL